MSVNTADDLYELARQLSTSERLHLVEKIAHGLTVAGDPREPPSERNPASGTRTRVELVGRVTDIAVEPLRFTIRTAHGEVSVAADANLLDAVWGAWGQEVILDAEAFLDFDGKTLDASAISLEVSAEADDLLSNFESTFGSGSDLWTTAEARDQTAKMRGGGP